jgi:hypothetical protein
MMSEEVSLSLNHKFNGCQTGFDFPAALITPPHEPVVFSSAAHRVIIFEFLLVLMKI